jgi:hypothetical protein
VKIPQLYRQINSTGSADVRIKRQQRTFLWQGDELTIVFNMSSLQSPLCTRLTPPLSWISASGCKVRVLHRGCLSSNSELMDIVNAEENAISDGTSTPKSTDQVSTIEIVATRSFVEDTLSCFRMNGFQREDLFRILDKGPWILAMDVRTVIPRLFADLQVHNYAA